MEPEHLASIGSCPTCAAPRYECECHRCEGCGAPDSRSCICYDCNEYEPLDPNGFEDQQHNFSRAKRRKETARRERRIARCKANGTTLTHKDKMWDEIPF